MKQIFLVLFVLIFSAQPMLAENWFVIDNTWRADRDSIITTKKYTTVWLHNTKQGIYYYNRYLKDSPFKIVRQKQIGESINYYPYGENPIPINNDDSAIIKAIMNPSYVYVSKENTEKSAQKGSFICLELKYAMSRGNHSVDKHEYFYIDTVNNAVFDHRKQQVNAVEEFNDEIIKFVTISPANDSNFNLVTYYTINRYTGSVKTVHQSSPANGIAKFSRALATGLYDVTFGEGTGTAKKVEKVKQQF